MTPKSALKLEALESRAVPTAVTWTGNGSSLFWSDDANWNTNHHPISNDNVSIPANVSSFDDVQSLDLASLALGGGDNVTLQEQLLVNGTAAPVAIASTGPQNVIHGAGGLHITGGATTVNVAAGSRLVVGAHIDGPVDLVKTGAGTLEFDNDNSYTGATKVYGGTLALNDSSAASSTLPGGVLDIGQGTGVPSTVRLMNNNQLSDTADVLLGSDGVLDLNGFSDTVGGLTLVGGSAVTTGAGTMTLHAGIILATGGVNAAGTVTGNIDLGTTNQIFAVIDTGTGRSLAINGVISGGPNAALIKNGPGQLTLNDTSTAANTYSGKTWVQNGVLALNTAGANTAVSNQVEIGDGIGAAGSAVLRLLQSSEIPTAAPIMIDSDGRLDLNGFRQTVGPLTLDTGAAVTTGPGNSLLTLNGDVGYTTGGANTATITGNLDLGAADRTFTVASGGELDVNAVVTGTGGLIKDGTATLLLEQTSPFGPDPNTYTGQTWVKDGVLQVNVGAANAGLSKLVVVGDGVGGAGSAVLQLLAGEQIPDDATVTVNPDGRFDLQSAAETIGDLSFPVSATAGGVVTGDTSAQLILNGDILAGTPGVGPHLPATVEVTLALPSGTHTVDAMGTAGVTSLTINGAVLGSGAVVKTGTGRLVMLGHDEAVGGTTVNAGGLAFDGSFMDYPVTVHAGVLTGTGTVSQVNGAGGQIMGDNGPSTLQVASALNLGATTFAPEIQDAAPGDYDLIDVLHGVINITGATLAPILPAGSTLSAGQPFTVIKNEGGFPVNGTFNGLPEGASFSAGGRQFQITYHGNGGNDVVLTDVGLGSSPPPPPGSPPPPASPPPPPPPPVPPPGTITHLIAVAADAGGPGTVDVSTATGKAAFTLTPFPGFAGGIRVATADVNGDGTDDVIAATGPGGPGFLAVFDGATRQELFRTQPFESSFTGGLFVAAGDVNGDGRADVVVTPDEGGGPRVTVFDGFNFARVADFFGIDDPNFRGGARAAVGDVTGKGYGDLIVAAGFQGGPRVAGYDGKSVVAGTPQHIFGDFFAFEQTLRNGAFLAVGDVNGDGHADLIAGGGPGGGPRVTVFDGAALLGGRQTPLANFFAGNPGNRGGERVAAADLNGDGHADLITGPGPGGGSTATVYDGLQLGAASPPGAFDLQPFSGFNGGVFVG